MVLSLIGPIRLSQLFDFVKVRSANPPSFSKSSFYGHIQASFFSLFLHLIKSVLAQIHGAEKRHVNRLTNRGQFPADIRPTFWPTFYQFSADFRPIFGRYPADFRRWSPECRLWLDDRRHSAQIDFPAPKWIRNEINGFFVSWWILLDLLTDVLWIK